MYQTKCETCKKFHIIPMFEGQIDACCTGSTKNENNENLHKTPIYVRCTTIMQGKETMADLFPIRKKPIRCEFYIEKKTN